MIFNKFVKWFAITTIHSQCLKKCSQVFTVKPSSRSWPASVNVLLSLVPHSLFFPGLFFSHLRITLIRVSGYQFFIQKIFFNVLKATKILFLIQILVRLLNFLLSSSVYFFVKYSFSKNPATSDRFFKLFFTVFNFVHFYS